MISRTVTGVLQGTLQTVLYPAHFVSSFLEPAKALEKNGFFGKPSLREPSGSATCQTDLEQCIRLSFI
jgi:hypothetical protein